MVAEVLEGNDMILLKCKEEKGLHETVHMSNIILICPLDFVIYVGSVFQTSFQI